MEELETEIQLILIKYFGKNSKAIDIESATEEILDLINELEDSYDLDMGYGA